MPDQTAVHARQVSEEHPGMLLPCVSPASFWAPQHIVPSAWLEHAPFGFWLMDALRPRVLVELGTHAGFSFLALCQAVERLRLPTACYAVDTWLGDEHAGFYGEDIFQNLSGIQARHYAGFSQLIRARFDEARAYFSDGEIDLLHIDGRHHYEDVVEDYSTWLPKLSEQAIVLFHDINVRERGFGVWRLWEDLREKHPSFEFIHGHGLGVLCPGPSVPPGVRPLFAASEDVGVQIRHLHARLGAAISPQFKLEQTLVELGGRVQVLQQQLDAQQQSESDLRTLLYEMEKMACFRNDAVASQQTVNQLQADLSAIGIRFSSARDELGAIRASTTWRILGIVRSVGTHIPLPVRRQLRRGLKALWWAATPYRMPARIGFLRARGAQRAH
ncbi:class I SAM-dependent methyltransferase [Paraburkholderia sp. BCC1885]|uniref:class I SAM-dependent methyltransferase n=1 Tax=Paraburkholderia sp. BCC1885 TaxID=2562669 RepID=UPI001C912D98|nr:class I SAM-dependent methyltransferase [Paraburkholderia sp. BCC1885]